jgi:hypothetical protein
MQLTDCKKSKVMLRSTVSRPLRLRVWGSRPYFITVTCAGLLMWGALCDERTCLSFTIPAALASAVILRSESRGTHDHILLSQIRDSPNLEGQVPVFISPRNRVAQLYSQALGSLFIVSYDSQGYGGDTGSRLHTDTLISFHCMLSI